MWVRWHVNDLSRMLFHSRAKTDDGRVLSNFYPSETVYDRSVEGFFQGLKCLFVSGDGTFGSKKSWKKVEDRFGKLEQAECGGYEVCDKA